MTGKILKAAGILVAVFVLLLLAAPFVFKGKIVKMVKDTANEMLDARVDFEDVSLNLFRNFPNASVMIDDFIVVGKGDFEQDTLLRFDRLRGVVDIKSLFGDQIVVNRVQLKNPYVFARVLADGRANWEILKDTGEDETEELDAEEAAFRLQLDKLTIENAYLYYVDSLSKMSAALENLNFTMSGDMTQSATDLDIYTTIERASYELDFVPLLNRAEVEAKIALLADFANNKYIFGENSVRVNAILLNFQGWLAVLDEGLDMDLKLNAPQMQFKDLLSMIPAIYAKDFETIQTKGALSFDAFAKGVLTDSIYPAFDVKLNVADAYFKYPDLPASVDDINIAAQLSNPGGDVDLTELNISNLRFKIKNNPFGVNLYAKNFFTDPYFKAGANGVLDLGTIKDVYPLDSMELSGVLTADLSVASRMSYIEKEQYEKIAANGKLLLNDAVYRAEGLPDVAVNALELVFSSRNLALNSCDVQIANTDLHATGTLDNYMAYLLRDDTLRGTLNLASEQISLNDFITADEDAAPAESVEEVESDSLVVLPKNIDFTMKADLKKILYDKMVFENLRGTIVLKDGVLNLKNANMNAFGGAMSLNAVYDTSKETEAKVDADMNISEVLYTEVFKQMDMAQKLAPVFENMTGKFSAVMTVGGLMDQTLSLVYPTVNGKGTLKSRELSVSNLKVLDAMAIALQKEELKTIKAKNMTLPFEIREGRVYTGPFDIKSGNLDMTVEGSSGLDETLDYITKITIPQQVTSLPVKLEVKIGGTFDKPKVKLGASETLNAVKDAAKEKVNEATAKLVEEARKQKENLMNEAQKAGDKLVAEAQKAGDKLVAEAKAEAEKAVAKASNPLGKVAAQKAGEAAVKAAQKKSDELVAAAKKQSDNLLKTATEKGDALISDAEKKTRLN